MYSATPRPRPTDLTLESSNQEAGGAVGKRFSLAVPITESGSTPTTIPTKLLLSSAGFGTIRRRASWPV
jgi:hypothetical protein